MNITMLTRKNENTNWVAEYLSRSWFDGLTTNGIDIAVRPELVEG
jgi:hypothetical protein